MPVEPRLPSRSRSRLSFLLAALLLVALPSLLLYESLFEGQQFLPFDMSTFPPASCSLTPEEIQSRQNAGNYDITEKSSICTPEFRLAREALLEGQFPHWNPYVRGGAPLFANALDGFAYPFHLPFLLFDPDAAYGLVAWFDFVLAGLFMLGFLRSIGLGWLAASFGAVSFQLSGTLAANAHFFMRMEPLIWLPAGFWALERLFHARGAQRLPSLAGFTCSLGLCWLAGFPPYALAVSLAFGLYILELVRRTWMQQGAKLAWHFSRAAGIAVLLGLGIAMIQLLPMLDYFPESQRELEQGLGALVAQGLDPSGLAGLVLPQPFTSPIAAESIPSVNNPLLYLGWSLSDPESGRLFLPYAYFNYTEYAIYIGALPIIAALIAMLRASVRFRFFAFVGLLFFGLLATASPLFELLWPLSVFQSTPPFRYAAVLGFFLAALAAVGFDVGAEGLRRRGFWTCCGLGFLLLLASAYSWWQASAIASDPGAVEALAQQISAKWTPHYPEVAGDLDKVKAVLGAETHRALAPTWAQYAFTHLAQQLRHLVLLLIAGLLWLGIGRWRQVRHNRFWSMLLRVIVLAVVALDLLVAARKVTPSFPQRDTANTLVHKYLREQREAHRENGGFMVARISKAPIEPKQLPPNTLVPEHIRDLNAYAFVDRNSHRPFHRLYGQSIKLRGEWLRSFPVDKRLEHPLFDLYGVRFLLSEQRFDLLGSPAIRPLQGPGGAFYVYERPSALPRAFLVRSAQKEPDPEKVLGYLTGKNLAPRELVLLQERFGKAATDNDEGLLANAEVTPEQVAAASVRFSEKGPGELHLIIRNSPGAWLLLTDTAMRNWRLVRDGRPAPWWRANLSFRATWVPVGDHELHWIYDAQPFRQGLWISAGAMALVLLMMLWWTGAPRQQEGSSEFVELSSKS
ncbi:MAG: hypothetical protein CSA62_06920 [Planctomycetota bacterium]|nr:MAG: hypothetical protein CSA62_06920 [Planctomycetota bacterium]